MSPQHPSELPPQCRGIVLGEAQQVGVFAWGFAGVHRAGMQEAAGTRVLRAGCGDICRQMCAISA